MQPALFWNSRYNPYKRSDEIAVITKDDLSYVKKMHVSRNHSMKFTRLLPPIIIGNIFEWYDFSLYGYLAPLITKLFFPQIAPSLGLVATFAIFTTGYIARPAGSFIFGYYGDKSGPSGGLLISPPFWKYRAGSTTSRTVIPLN